jgi:hypothetical protein
MKMKNSFSNSFVQLSLEALTVKNIEKKAGQNATAAHSSPRTGPDKFAVCLGLASPSRPRNLTAKLNLRPQKRGSKAVIQFGA